jgi:hypothetical protein
MVARTAKRLGVGATASATTKKDAVADWTKSGKKKILSIGKRRSAHSDDEDAAAIDGTNKDANDSSSDEEEGRTSAVKEKKRKIHHVNNETSDTAAEVQKSKKKKKGKKERNAQGAADESNTNSTADNEAEVKADKSEVNNGDFEQKKHKRKKTRSKQKNIRKDSRSESERPSYLNAGSSGYAGRPLTKATKEKLGLSTAQKKEVRASSGSNKNNTQTASDIQEIPNNEDGATAEHRSTNEGSALSKIGDCVVGELVVGSEKKSQLKKLRRKFKNC